MKPTKDERILVELGILNALFGATIEQSQVLNGELKHVQNKIFKEFQDKGEFLFRKLELVNEPEVKAIIEKCTDAIHDAVHEIRKINGL